MSKGVCIIIGYGPGLGAAYANVFGQVGYDLALVSRSGAGADHSIDGVAVRAYESDAGSPEKLRQTLEAISNDMGRIDLVIYNAGLAVFGTLEDVTEAQFEASWRVGVQGLFTTAKLLGPQMAERGDGTIIVTGATAALRGNVWTTGFAPSKSAQRILAQSLAKQLGPKGVHVAYLVIDGVIDTADTRAGFAKGKPDEFFMAPDKIAKAALAVAQQDRSAWTFEMDLRPFGETW